MKTPLEHGHQFVYRARPENKGVRVFVWKVCRTGYVVKLKHNLLAFKRNIDL